MLTERIEVPQIACAITYTNETSHAVIADHRDGYRFITDRSVEKGRATARLSKTK